LEKKYRAKVTKIITEWSELFERYNKMRTKDPEGAERYKSEMTARFRKTVSSLEDENKEQRRQLEEVHDERVQSALNEKKRKVSIKRTD
jgi:esterase/lipase